MKTTPQPGTLLALKIALLVYDLPYGRSFSRLHVGEVVTLLSAQDQQLFVLHASGLIVGVPLGEWGVELWPGWFEVLS